MDPTDVIANLVTLLNQIEGLEFVEDAWVEKAPDNYGVVELTGQIAAEYGDGHVLDQAYRVRITIYVTGGSHAWIQSVQSVLDGLDIIYTMPQREYLQDINKVSWVWDAEILSPIIGE